MSGGLEQLGTSAGKLVGQLRKMAASTKDGYQEFKSLDESIRGSGTSFSDYIRYTSESEDATEAFGLATLYTKARVIALNMALSAGIGLIVSYFSKKIIEAAQRTDKLAESTKEVTDAATGTTSSLKNLVSEYKNLGDKSDWDTDDMERAQEIQDKILQLAKDQGTLDESRVKKIDLQNGKYQEQLALLKDISKEQLKATQPELIQSKDAQAAKLVKTAKDTNRSHMFGTIWSTAEMQMGDQIKNAGIDIFNWAGGYGADNLNDADSIVDYYNNLGKAIEYIINNTKDEERAVNGKYHSLYQFLMDERDALKADVDSYNDAVTSLKQNKMASDFAVWGTTDDKKSGMNTLDSKIKATKEYQNAVKQAQDTEAEWTAQGFSKYGNVDNFHRDKIDWTDENKKKYSQFVKENPDETSDDYSTVLGQWEYLSKYADVANEDQIFTFSPMLQTDSGLVPLTRDQLTEYLQNVVQQATDENGKVDIGKLMELDATGLKQDINGVMMQVKGMIAGVEGGTGNDGRSLTRADILAISGDSNEDIVRDYYGDDADKYYGLGNLSRYVGKSMHDAQAVAQEGKDNIEAVYNQLYSDLDNGPATNSGGADSAAVRYVNHIQSAFEILADSLGKDSREMTISDVVGLTADGVDLTDEQASALDTLTAAADKYGTTIQGVAQAGEENGLFGGIENAVNGTAKAIQQMETISQNIDNIQSAYKACNTAMEEYNKYGYMSADALQGLLSMNDEYLACLDVVDGKLQINNERYADLIVAQYTEAEATAIDQAMNELNALQKEDTAEKTESLTTATKEQQTALENAVPAIQDATTATGDLAIALATAQGAAGDDEEMQAKINTITTALNTKLTAIHTNMQAAIKGGKELKNQLNGFDKDKSGNSASKSVTDVASAFDTLTKAMKEYNQYGYISADTMKSMMTLEDKFTSCLIKNGTTLAINANEFRKLVETQLEEEEANGKASKSTDELKRILSYLDKNVKSSTISFEQLTDIIKGYGTAIDDAKEKTDTIKSAFSSLYDVGTKKKDNDFGFLDADSVEKQYQAVRDLYDKTDLFTNEKYKDALNPETGEIDYNSDAFKQMFADHLKELAGTARETGGAAGEYLAQGFEDAAAKISQNVMSIREYIDGIGSSLQYATDRIDHFQSGFSDISDIVNEYNTYGGLSIDNYQKLMSLDDDYIKCLSLEGDQLKFNTQAYKDLFIAKILAMADEYDKADQTKALAQRLRELADAASKSTDGFTMATDAAKNFETTLSNIKSLLSDLIGVFEQFNTNKSNDLKIQGDAWLEVIDNRIDALNEANDAQERAIELQKAQDALAKAEANKTVHVYHANGTGFEWEADQNAVRDAQSTLNDTIRNNRKQDELDRLNKLKDAVQKNNELIGSSFEDYEKKKKYLAEFDKMTYDQMIEYNDTWKDTIIGNMKSTQAVTNINDTITKLEKLISTLETLNNVLKWIDSVGSSTDGGGLTGLFSSGGLFSKIGKFFNIASEDGLGAALNQTGEWFSGKLSAALEANPNNPIIKAFSNIWTKVGEDASTFFKGSSGTGLGGIVKTGLDKVGAWLGNLTGNAGADGILGDLATKTVTSGGSGFIAKLLGGGATTAAATGTAEAVGAAGATTVGAAATTASSSIPIIGPIIAVAVNQAVQQFGKISKENTKIWADENSSTGEKIVKSVGNVLYHLSPVESWDKAMQYAQKTADADGVWEKLKNGAKTIYYASGLGVVIDNILSTIKSILGIFGIKFKDNSDDVNTSSTVSDKKGIGSWKIWPWNWGKKAKGDKKIDKSAPYNVDEQGEEIIVRKPQTGRMTYLEKGDGVVPANETATLMQLAKNPFGWFTSMFGKSFGSNKSGGGIFSRLFGNLSSVKKEATNAASDILSGVKKVFSGNSVTQLVSTAKSQTEQQIAAMKATFESAWKDMADETGISQKQIEATSAETFGKMQKLVEQTYASINENSGLSSEQVQEITNELFDSLQDIYTSGWNSVYATSTKMSEKTANKLNDAYTNSSAACKSSMKTITGLFNDSWSKCGGGVKKLSDNTYKTLSKSWADSSDNAEKMMYDVRACFDTSWGKVEQGTSQLADGTETTLNDSWESISSKSDETLGSNGTLKTDADNAWSNVEPGATNLANNMQWVMDQSYDAMKKGCSEAVDEINQKLNTTADSFKAVADASDTSTKKEDTPAQTTEKKSSGSGWAAAGGALAGAAVGGAVGGPVGALLGAAGGAIGGWLLSKKKKHATGVASVKKPHMANVDEQGPEMLVRQPQSGRYTYLETGDGVVPADITSRLFEMGGNPDKWFNDQMSKYGSQSIATKSSGNMSFSTGDIIIQNPVGNVNDLATQIEREMPNKMAQAWNKR